MRQFKLGRRYFVIRKKNKDIFSRYYTYKDVYKIFKSLTMQCIEY